MESKDCISLLLPATDLANDKRALLTERLSGYIAWHMVATAASLIPAGTVTATEKNINLVAFASRSQGR